MTVDLMLAMLYGKLAALFLVGVFGSWIASICTRGDLSSDLIWCTLPCGVAFLVCSIICSVDA